MNEIKRNFAWDPGFSDDSFVGILHERGVWDDDEYLKLENCLYEESERYRGRDTIPRKIFWPAMRIYSYLSQLIGCHLDPNDGFEIKELDLEQVYRRRERLQLVFEGFFKGEMPKRNSET